jgi:hypothetical protein
MMLTFTASRVYYIPIPLAGRETTPANTIEQGMSQARLLANKHDYFR